MVGRNCELELQTEIALWRSKNGELKLIDEFNVRGERIEMRLMKLGLTWSFEARPLPNSRDYIFTNLDLKQYKAPGSLSPKLKLLVVALKTHLRSVEELLDKLYACSCFLFHAKNDKECWIIVDAQIMAVVCKTATEATQQAAKAAAAFLVELMEPRLAFDFPRQRNITEEAWNDVAKAAVKGGNVLHWCKVRVLERNMIPCFEFEVAVQEILQGNAEICKIGIVNNSALKVAVCLEEVIRVVCSEEGVETATSLGLNSLLPKLITGYITTAAERKDGIVENVVEGLLQRVVGYLTFLPRVCELCGSPLLREDSSSSTYCSYLCEARKDTRAWNIALPWTVQQGLSSLLLTDDDFESDHAEDLFN